MSRPAHTTGLEGENSRLRDEVRLFREELLDAEGRPTR